MSFVAAGASMLKFVIVFSRTLLERFNPIFWPAISWTILLLGFGSEEFLIRSLGWRPYTRDLAGLVVGAAMVSPIAGFSVLAMSYSHNSERLGRIISLYLALILLCANVNFLLVLHFGHFGPSPIHGVHRIWTEAEPGHPMSLHASNVLPAIVDCIHFSVATLTTVGYGDIYPTEWYSKLIVDTECLLGLGISILTFGRYFSRLSGSG